MTLAASTDSSVSTPWSDTNHLGSVVVLELPLPSQFGIDAMWYIGVVWPRTSSAINEKGV